MKKLMMICAFMFAGIVYANAQQGNGGNYAERTQKMIATLTEKLKLTDAQKVQVDTIFSQQNKAMMKMRADAGDDRSQMREKMMGLRAESDKKINAILNDEQKTTYKAWQDERTKAMEARRNGN